MHPKANVAKEASHERVNNVQFHLHELLEPEKPPPGVKHSSQDAARDVCSYIRVSWINL